VLGRLPVARIGLGAMQLTGPGIFGPLRDHDEALAVPRTAVDGGIDHIDTADYYGPDVVNDLIREACTRTENLMRLVSKVGARRDPTGGVLG